jgi:transposase
MLADELDFVVGVDPHRDAHALAVVEVRTGVVVVESSVAADGGGYAEALRVAEQHAPGRRAFAIEGAGSFGAGLARVLTEQGEQVFEVGRLRRERRSRGKTDARCGPGRSERVRAEAACPAAQQRRARGAAGVDGRPQRGRERETGRALPAA